MTGEALAKQKQETFCTCLQKRDTLSDGPHWGQGTVGVTSVPLEN